MIDGRRSRQSAGPTRYSPALSDDASAAPALGATDRRDTSALIGVDRLSVLVAGEGVYATHTLPTSGTAIIGRASDADICIDNHAISRRHAKIQLGPPLLIEDCDSANGTWVADRRLATGEVVPIQLNESLRLGPITVIVQRRPGIVTTRRVRSHDYFESRVEEECSRAARTNTHFVILQVVVVPANGDTLQAMIASCLRESDVIAEYAPGEFEALLLDTEPAQIEVVTERIAQACAALGLRATCGTAIFSQDGRDTSTLLRHARNLVHGGEEEARLSSASVVVVDEVMSALHAMVTRVAAGDISVLLLGETGVGKEVIAESIHRQSPRAAKPFVRLNCAAFTETLLESELFGHERGSFTGAVAAKPGLLEIAEGGSVFLDEVGELAAATQVKLLRVLDERKVMRVGGLKPRDIDVRLISATNRDLEREIQRGGFRSDLLYRLNAMSIVIPPLRERVAEIEPLARHFVKRLSAGRQSRPPRISAEAIKVLVSYSWPGNVRELKNVIERALILCDGLEIEAKDLPVEKMHSTFTFGAGSTPSARPPDVSTSARPRRTSSSQLVVAVPRDHSDARRVPRGGPDRDTIMATLDRCAGNQTNAAHMLGVSRRTLINWIEKLDIQRPRKR